MVEISAAERPVLVIGRIVKNMLSALTIKGIFNVTEFMEKDMWLWMTKTMFSA